MERDVALLDDVAHGASPVLRFYRWHTPALSLGRFQPEDDVDPDACADLGVDVVRRPTGGKAILHGSDLTYAVAMRRPPGAAGTVDAVYDALWASRDQPDATRNGGLPPVPAPEVRLARVRMLTHWNDRAERTQEEVLAVVDRAISATIMDLMSAPRPPAQPARR